MENNKYPYKLEDLVFRYKERKYKQIPEVRIGTFHFGMISWWDIYQIVKQHSRLIDRINPRKMFAMTMYISDLLHIEDDELYNLITNLPWKFYGRKHNREIPLWE